MVRELSLDVFRETLWNHEVLRNKTKDELRAWVEGERSAEQYVWMIIMAMPMAKLTAMQTRRPASINDSTPDGDIQDSVRISHALRPVPRDHRLVLRGYGCR
jgi:hypothetical protein